MSTDLNWTQHLIEKLESSQDKDSKTIPNDKIDEFIQQFTNCIGSYIPTDKRKDIYNQISSVLIQVKELKTETFQMGEEILKDNFIPDIAVELHSVITQTEKSVEGILDVSDAIRNISKGNVSSDLKEDLVANSTKLLELCNFQDLTGQIIQRIIKRLTAIETTIGDIFYILRQDPRVITSSKCETTKVDKLLNGPQKEEDRPSQQQVDDLFNSV